MAKLTCPYCDIEITESAIEGNDGCCPECGAAISGGSSMYMDDYDDELDDFDDGDFDDDFDDEDLGFDDFDFDDDGDFDDDFDDDFDFEEDDDFDDELDDEDLLDE
ncbi:MAG: hypothetical protein IJW31_06850 [Lentisphaeria bacterium]|nr:hypothetical protein [Lentisphaeria bacterium]